MPWIFLYIQPCCHRQGIDSGLKKWRLHVDLHFGHGWVFNSLDVSGGKIIWRHGLLFLNRLNQAISCDSSFHHGHMEIGEDRFVWSWAISRVDYAPILQWRLAKCWNNLFRKSCHLPHFLCVSLFLHVFPEIFTEVWYSGNSTGVHHVRGISSGIHVQGGWLCRWSCIRFPQDIGFSPGICWICPPGKLRFIGISY